MNTARNQNRPSQSLVESSGSILRFPKPPPTGSAGHAHVGPSADFNDQPNPESIGPLISKLSRSSPGELTVFLTLGAASLAALTIVAFLHWDFPFAIERVSRQTALPVERSGAARLDNLQSNVVNAVTRTPGNPSSRDPVDTAPVPAAVPEEAVCPSEPVKPSV